MEELRQWGFGLCCAALAGSVVQLLAPPGQIQRIMGMVVGAFFLCCLVAPLGSLTLPDINLNRQNTVVQQNADDYSQQTNDLFYGTARQCLQQLAVKKLAEMGINNAEVAVYINETKNELQPEDIVLEAQLPARWKDQHELLCRRLEYELGITVRLGYKKEPEG